MIIHYLATHPNFLPLAFMGFTIALGLSLWGKVQGQGCLIVPLYLYVFGVWFFTCITLFLTAPDGQEGFIVGFALYHYRAVFEWGSTAFFWMIEKNRQWNNRQWKEAEDQAKEEPAWQQHQENQHQQRQTQQQQTQNQHQQNQQRAREEQARREQEARQYF